MSRTTRALTLTAALALAAPAGATAAGPLARAAALDRAPMQLPPSGARAAAVGGDWLMGIRPTAAAARLARRHGARRLLVPGAWAVPTAGAGPLAGALRRRGLLRWAQ